MSLSYDSHCTFEFCIVMSRQIEIVSASLLVTPSHSSRPDSNFCLGLLDWCPGVLYREIKDVLKVT